MVGLVSCCAAKSEAKLEPERKPDSGGGGVGGWGGVDFDIKVMER